jgi:DNA-binding response OmpR family regulator
MMSVAEAYEVYYIDDRGQEHELGMYIEEPMEPERLRARIRLWITKMHGDEEARKWDYYGPRYRKA